MLWKRGRAYAQDLRERVFAAFDAGLPVGQIAAMLLPGFAVTGHTRGGSAPGKPRNCWVSAAASGRNGRKT